MAFHDCGKLIIFSVPQHTKIGEKVMIGTALMKASPFDDDYFDDIRVFKSLNERYFQRWLKNRHDKYPLHKICCGEQPTPELNVYNEIDWYRKDECGVTPVDYFIANFGEDDHIQYLPEFVQHLIKDNKLKGMSTDAIVEGQLAWQQQQITSLQSQAAEKDDKITTLQKEKYDFMSLNLLEDEIKCSLCCNKFSTDINAALPEIRRYLPVLSRAACPHYFCQGCIEKTQLSEAESAPRNKVPKWLKCMICKRKTAFCPEDPFYHMKLIELLERARRYHPIDMKVEEGQETIESGSNSNDDRPSKRQKVTNVAIKKEMSKVKLKTNLFITFGFSTLHLQIGITPSQYLEASLSASSLINCQLI